MTDPALRALEALHLELERARDRIDDLASPTDVINQISFTVGRAIASLRSQPESDTGGDEVGAPGQTGASESVASPAASRDAAGDLDAASVRNVANLRQLAAYHTDRASRLSDALNRASEEAIARECRESADTIERLQAELAEARSALEKIAALEVTGPSPIGPLHGAGMATGFDIAAKIAREALS